MTRGFCSLPIARAICRPGRDGRPSRDSCDPLHLVTAEVRDLTRANRLLTIYFTDFIAADIERRFCHLRPNTME